MDFDAKKMGRNIRAERNRLGLNQTELAKRVGVALTTVSSWETGQSSPDFVVAWKLADLFHVSLDALGGRE